MIALPYWYNLFDWSFLSIVNTCVAILKRSQKNFNHVFDFWFTMEIQYIESISVYDTEVKIVKYSCAKKKSITQWKCIIGHPFTNEQLLQRLQKPDDIVIFISKVFRENTEIYITYFTVLITKMLSFQITLCQNKKGWSRNWSDLFSNDSFTDYLITNNCFDFALICNLNISKYFLPRRQVINFTKNVKKVKCYAFHDNIYNLHDIMQSNKYKHP